MTTTYDKEADALYIEFIDSSVESTQGDWPFHVDLDAEGNVVGIEIMDASSIVNGSYLEKTSDNNVAD